MTDNHDIQLNSPEIEEIKWGYMKIMNYAPGKDFKLFPGGAENWNWNETNTRHVPGIQRQDVEDLINKGAKYIILSKGMENQLQVPKETEDFLEDKKKELNIHYFIETTTKACEVYNQLVKENKPVGALMHSTC